MIINAALMDYTPMFDVLAPANSQYVCLVDAGFLTVTVPPETAIILKPGEHSLGGYSRYKRVR